MAEDAKKAWGEVGEKFSSWGHRVAARYHASGPTEADQAEEAERALKRELKDLFDELAKGVSAVGATLKDDEAKRDLSEAATAIGDAITATITEATEALRARGGAAPPPPPPPPPGED